MWYVRLKLYMYVMTDFTRKHLVQVEITAINQYLSPVVTILSMFLEHIETMKKNAIDLNMTRVQIQN